VDEVIARVVQFTANCSDRYVCASWRSAKTEMRLWQRDTKMDRRATAALPSDPSLTPDEDDGGDDNK
jgi:hypothetical protein